MAKLLEVAGLGAAYGRTPVLHQVEFSMQAGHITAILGANGAGKSTLINRLLGANKMLTGPEPGITRDSIATRFTDAEGRVVELVDTAGLRRRARIEAPLEKMSASSAIEALKMAEVVVLTADATEVIHDQDLTIAKLIEREGRACVIALNK